MRTEEIINKATRVNEAARQWEYSTRKARILIVDDEVSATGLLKKNLEQTGVYIVRTENDSSDCIRSAIEFRPDLILLDVMMPGTDGGELAGILRADPRFRSTPIVFLTAVATKGEVNKGSGAIGGMPFLAKPAGMHEVLACLNEQLNGNPDRAKGAGDVPSRLHMQSVTRNAAI